MSKVGYFQGQVPNTATELFSATRVGAIHAAAVCNTSASAVTLQVWLAYDGGAAADGNKVYDALSVDANSQVSLALLINQALKAGTKVYAQASAATALTLTIAGAE